MAAKKSTKGKSGNQSPGTALVTATAANALQLPAGIKKVKAVITPTLSLKENEPRYIVLLEAMHVSNYIDPKRTADKTKKQKAATICRVGDVQTGEELLLLVPSVLESSLNEAYPEAGYVGKAFMVEKLPKRPGKDYFDCRCVEIDVSALTASATT